MWPYKIWDRRGAAARHQTVIELVVGSIPTRRNKLFSFPHSGNKTKRGYVYKIGWKFSVSFASPSICGIQREAKENLTQGVTSNVTVSGYLFCHCHQPLRTGPERTSCFSRGLLPISSIFEAIVTRIYNKIITKNYIFHPLSLSS